MRAGLEKKETKPQNTSGITSEKNTRLFFIIATAILSIFTIFLLVNILNKTGILSSDSEEDLKPKNVQQLIQVEVLNGCGVAGAGDVLTDLLRKKGIDVVKTGNYRSFNIDNTFIVDRMNNLETAYKVADSLNINKKFVITEINKALFIDLTIVIGKDYNEYFQISRSID